MSRKNARAAFTNAVAAYLESIGWRAIVVGPVSIERRARLEYNWRFVVDFTGGPRRAEGRVRAGRA